MNESHKRHSRRKAVGLRSFAVCSLQLRFIVRQGGLGQSLGHSPGGRLAREGLGGEASALYCDSAVLLKRMHLSKL